MLFSHLSIPKKQRKHGQNRAVNPLSVCGKTSERHGLIFAVVVTAAADEHTELARRLENGGAVTGSISGIICLKASDAKRPELSSASEKLLRIKSFLPLAAYGVSIYGNTA